MAAVARILVIDDEPQIRRFLRIALAAQGYEVIEADGARTGLAAAALRTPDLVILDLGLPDQDGKEAIKALRDWSKVPLLVLSVRSDEQEKVAALDAGANDYVTKPFGIGELLARVRVLLRLERADASRAGASEIRVGSLLLDLARHRVFLEDREIHLSRKEYALLKLLAENAGRILTHQQILRAIWGPAHLEDTHYLRVYVGQLRQKLGDDPTAPRFIVNEPGVGYRFADA